MARPDDEESSFQRIRRRAPSRRAQRSATDLTVSQAEAERFAAKYHDDAPAFKEQGLQELHERGLLERLVCQLKSGKEATVYLGYSEQGPVAVKLYMDLHVRSFRNDDLYRQGRFIGDARLQRAIDARSRRGMAAQESLWVEEEFRQLHALYDAGVHVPKPLGHAGRAIAMEFIGVGEEPAPRLSDIRLAERDAGEAFDQAVDNLRRIVRSGRVHGDYSTYNLLWHKGRVVVIDLPQVVDIAANGNAAALLRRDVESLCRSFRRLGVRCDAGALWRAVAAEMQ
jgi:RIO kinase 1